MKHGSPHTYTNHRCRCDDCRAAATAYVRELRRKRVQKAREGSIPVPHGTANAYRNYGCRCDECRRAATEKSIEQGHTSGQRIRQREKRADILAVATSEGVLVASRRFGVARMTVYRWLEEEGLQPHVPPLRGHGTHACYTRGCRCGECVAAYREYERERKARARQSRR